MADKNGEPEPGEKNKPEKKPERARDVQPQPQMTFVVRVLMDWAAEPYGKLLLMGISLLFIGGVLTLGSWVTRDEKGEFHVWFAFFFVGAASLVFGILAWIWKMLRRDRKLK